MKIQIKTIHGTEGIQKGCVAFQVISGTDCYETQWLLGSAEKMLLERLKTNIAKANPGAEIVVGNHQSDAVKAKLAECQEELDRAVEQLGLDLS
jgi:hypothetical protein